MTSVKAPDIIETHPAVLSPALKTELAAIEAKATKFSLADAIRAGSHVTDQAYTWRDGDNVCALSAAALAVKARKA